MQRKKIYLIDGNSFIYRMFFGLPEFRSPDGEVVNAIFGMAKFFIHQLVDEQPDYIIFITDAPGKNFRNDLYVDYKATRDRMPDNLKSQISGINEMIIEMGVEIVSIPGYEADDVIGTLAHKYRDHEDYEVDILSGDKDLYSLIAENVKIYDTMKKKKFGIEESTEKFGVTPSYVVDYLAIVGDKADNIPGIDGFGPKKAVDLINNVGGIEEIYKKLDTILSGDVDIGSLEPSIQSCFKGKTLEKLTVSRENAFLSKRLATVDLHVVLEGFELEKFRFIGSKMLTESVVDLFKKYNFHSLLSTSEVPKRKKWTDLTLGVQLILSEAELVLLGKNMFEKYSKIVLDTETTGLDVTTAELVGISLYLDDDNIFYINRLHSGKKISDELLSQFVTQIFSSDLEIIGHNLKYDCAILEQFLENMRGDNKTIQHTDIFSDKPQQTLIGF